MARDTRSRLQKRASRAGLFLNDELADGLIAYYELLYRWNRKINLTALTDGDQAIDRLLVEPVLAARYLPSVSSFLHLDIGSGGGSPAIPMSLAVAGMELRMVEVKARKSAFLREAVRGSVGTVFRTPIAEASSAASIAWLRERGVRVVVATPDGARVYRDADLARPLALVVGNERYGLTDRWLEAADETVRIPMAGPADSLNVAVAAGIVLFEAAARRPPPRGLCGSEPPSRLS